MTILGRYVTRVFLSQLLLVLISAVSLLQLFEVMSEADDLLADLGGTGSVILKFSLLRLPILVTFLLPFSTLIAGILAFGRLHRSSELVAMQALGMALPRVLLLLLPCMLGVVGLHFFVNDQLSPPATRMLTAWEAETKSRQPNDIALWLHDGEDIVSIGEIEDGGQRLKHLVIFHRDDDGNLIRQATAEQVHFDGDNWWLEGINQLRIQPKAEQTPILVDRELWKTELRPDVIHDLAAPADALSIAEISSLLSLPDISSRPAHVYRIWWHKSFAVPLASLFMVVLATASVRSLQRQGGAVLNAMIGFAGAFLYFVSDGVLTALGEAGSVPPVIAAWLPLLLLALAAGFVLLWVTMPRGRRKAASLRLDLQKPSEAKVG